MITIRIVMELWRFLTIIGVIAGTLAIMAMSGMKSMSLGIHLMRQLESFSRLWRRKINRSWMMKGSEDESKATFSWSLVFLYKL